MHTDSLRRQLIKGLSWPLAIILLAGSVFAYFFALNSAVNAYDLGLLNDALDISKQINVHSGKMTLNLPPVASQMLQTNNQDRVSYAAWDESGQIFSGDPKLQMADMLVSEESHIFQDMELNGEKHRAILLRGKSDGHVYFIAVAQTVHGRDHLTGEIFAGILLPVALLAIVSIAAILLGVRRGLSPIVLLRDEITSRSSNDLRPIEESTAPAELAPIIHGINELLENLATSFASHRRFIADAAHQLRTPLAALSGQIEVALEDPPPDEKKLLHQLLATTQRTTHLANQLLSLARLEHTEQFMYEVATVDLQKVLLESAADFVTLSARKVVELDFDLHPCYVAGSPLMLRELISNLLDNAVRYTPSGGRISVSMRVMAQHMFLTVEDNGPGVAEGELARLGTPFHRLPSDQTEGCGLGLAIVREITRLHGAEIFFERGADARGLKVRIGFPLALDKSISGLV
jgi:two-component system sensor histidine kinase TctE